MGQINIIRYISAPNYDEKAYLWISEEELDGNSQYTLCMSHIVNGEVVTTWYTCAHDTMIDLLGQLMNFVANPIAGEMVAENENQPKLFGEV